MKEKSREKSLAKPSARKSETTAAEKPERLYRGISNSERTAERRERFIQAAIQRFGSDGFHNSTLKSLCAEAGLTERYFYESFSNFDDLLCCSYQHAADTIYELTTAALAKAEATPEARMRATLETYFKAIAADPARARLLLLEMEGAGPRADEVYRAQLQTSANVIRFQVCAGLPSNPANGLSPELLAMAMMGATYQLAKVWALANFKLPREQLVRNLLAIFNGSIAEWQNPVAEKTRPETTKRKTK